MARKEALLRTDVSKLAVAVWPREYIIISDHIICDKLNELGGGRRQRHAVHDRDW